MTGIEIIKDGKGGTAWISQLAEDLGICREDAIAADLGIKIAPKEGVVPDKIRDRLMGAIFSIPGWREYKALMDYYATGFNTGMRPGRSDDPEMAEARKCCYTTIQMKNDAVAFLLEKSRIEWILSGKSELREEFTAAACDVLWNIMVFVPADLNRITKQDVMSLKTSDMEKSSILRSQFAAMLRKEQEE